MWRGCKLKTEVNIWQTFGVVRIIRSLNNFNSYSPNWRMRKRKREGQTAGIKLMAKRVHTIKKVRDINKIYWHFAFSELKYLNNSIILTFIYC